MSVVSSRVSSVSSILKASGVRAQFVKQPNKVYFKLPKDIKNILCNCATSDGINKEYEKLIHSLKDGAIKDSDLVEFLTEARQCISLLNIRHELFVQALLQIEWTNRSPEVISIYKFFLQDLVCMQTLHINIVINHLVELFKPENSNAEHEVGPIKSKDIERLNHIHDILHKILEVVPMSDKDLLQSLVLRFPYILHGTYTHEVYIYALLQILNYAPQLRSDILVFIIKKLIILDVYIPREKTSNDEEDEADDYMSSNDIADNDNLTDTNNDPNKRKTVHPIARTLDSCMELFLKYMHEFCFTNGVLQTENLKALYVDILCAFEAVILPTHPSQYVQYIMFYICSFRPEIAQKFTNWLWDKVTDPNVAPVLRQTTVCYISSLHATASFISPALVKITMSDLAQWIHKYIALQEDSKYTDDDAKHAVFYSVCQAFFYLFNARYKHFVQSKNGILFLQNLDISKIVTCKLNPLKICDNKISHDFADITSTYQLAYCFAIIENNERNQLPIFGMKTHLSVSVLNFSPFESYALEHSGQRITPLFRNNVASINNQSIEDCK